MIGPVTSGAVRTSEGKEPFDDEDRTMLGRKDYTPDEVATARRAVEEQLAAYRDLATAVDAAGDPKAVAALQAFEPVLANALVMQLDRFFVHRLRAVSGKDGNPLNEVEVLVESLLAGGGVVAAHKVIRLRPGRSVLGLAPGDRIRLTADRFEQLADAFFGELMDRFL